MRILVVTSLYPNNARPAHGAFVHERVRHLARRGHDVRVLAPVPWFPPVRLRSRWYSYSQVRHEEHRDGLPVLHPRFLAVPRIGPRFHGHTYFAAIERCFRTRLQGFRPDVLDAHYLYPDGFAAVRLGETLRMPVVVTARGTDVNVLSRTAALRPMIGRTLRGAARVVAVAEDLRRQLVELGAPAERTRTIPNGVLAERFHPRDRMEARARLGLSRVQPMILCVGNLVRLKGHRHAVRSAAALKGRWPGIRLCLVGEGPERASLEALARELKFVENVTLAGTQDQRVLADWYSAADVFCLPSEREGWPNAVMEALACGTPVVATRVNGVPEIVTSEALGLLVSNPATELTAALERALSIPWDRASIAAHGGRRSWDVVAREVEDLLEDVLREAVDAPRGPAG